MLILVYPQLSFSSESKIIRYIQLSFICWYSPEFKFSTYIHSIQSMFRYTFIKPFSLCSWNNRHKSQILPNYSGYSKKLASFSWTERSFPNSAPRNGGNGLRLPALLLDQGHSIFSPVCRLVRDCARVDDVTAVPDNQSARPTKRHCVQWSLKIWREIFGLINSYV